MYLLTILNPSAGAPKSTPQHLDIVTQHKKTSTDVSGRFSYQFLALLRASLAGQSSKNINSLHDDRKNKDRTKVDKSYGRGLEMVSAQPGTRVNMVRTTWLTGQMHVQVT